MAVEEAAAAAGGGGSSSSGKPVMVVGIDDSEHSYYALEWTLQHFFAPGQPQQYHLEVLTAKPPASSVIGIAGIGSAELLPTVEADLKRTVARVMDRARKLCAEATDDVGYEAVEGDARSVICDAVDRHHAEILVIGCHGYSKWKRAVLGSGSDYCTHHAHCSVMVVKRPKHKH